MIKSPFKVTRDQARVTSHVTRDLVEFRTPRLRCYTTSKAATTRVPGSRQLSTLLGDKKPKREGNDIAGTRVSVGRRGKEWGTGPYAFMGVPITEEISWMTDSPALSFVG